MKYKTAFRLAVKAIGVLILAQSLPGIVVMGAALFVGFLTDGLLGVFSFDWTWLLGYQLSYVVSAIIGCYLFLGGKWVVDHVVPSNRPYCHECAYELTGSPVEGACPECGTAYRRSVGDTTDGAGI